MSEVREFALTAPVYDRADVVVIGGGPAGVAAAIGAARLGRSVLLLERSGQLGGMATLGNVAVWMPVGNVTGIFREIISELLPGRLDDANPRKFAPLFNPLLLRHYLNAKLHDEGVKVVFHADFVASATSEGRVTAVAINTREGLRSVEGGVFIDCTGDGRVAIDAGAPHFAGREGDGMTQPMTLMFQMQDTGKPVQRNLPADCPTYEKVEDLPQGRLLHWENRATGTLLVNMTRVKGNGAKIDDVNDAEVESLRQAFGVADYLQRNGFERHILSHIADQVGVRQTNQIEGLYTLSEDDIVEGRQFDDVVAQSNYGIDIHSPDGQKTCDLREVKYYDIPYRCLVPKGLESLLVAGRCISASHVAMSSMRVQPTCFALGQAAGVAAAICVETRCSAADVPVEKLSALLADQGVHFDR
jgi:FAD-dependent oxidoreductase family protein